MPFLVTARSAALPLSRPLAGMLFVASLAGCSLLEDRSQRYVNAPEGTPIEVPEGADQSRFSEIMPVQTINTDDTRRYYASSIPKPPDMTSGILDENYVIEELDGRVWLLVNEVPGRLWPVVGGWMNQSGLGVAYDSPQLGVLQSELANFSLRSRELLGLDSQPAADEGRVFVQARLAPGIRRKTTEIRVRIVDLPESPDELVSWSDAAARSPEILEQQKALLAHLGEFLKSREDSKSFSRAASGMVSEPLVRLLSDNDDVATAVRVELDYGRTWSEVSRSLAEIDIPVMDLNRSEGWLQVDFRTEDERSPGWFSWFSSKDEPTHTHTVHVEQRDQAVYVTAEQVDGYTGEYTASDLLTRLFEHLY
ncbi:MAG TPA: outer membrane protein assembly factor BamC [Marinobacter sp.]|nr:outer membrane protein assembly factor BamC [Marinobacter sp.]